jgi:hypothetical protein
MLTELDNYIKAAKGLTPPGSDLYQDPKFYAGAANILFRYGPNPDDSWAKWDGLRRALAVLIDREYARVSRGDTSQPDNAFDAFLKYVLENMDEYTKQNRYPVLADYLKTHPDNDTYHVLVQYFNTHPEDKKHREFVAYVREHTAHQERGR